jgi:hypothetical protein
MKPNQVPRFCFFGSYPKHYLTIFSSFCAQLRSFNIFKLERRSRDKTERTDGTVYSHQMRWSPLLVQGSIQTGQLGGGGVVTAALPSSAAAPSISVVAKTLAPELDGI